jgi:pyrroline-5-carboxylate reductase
MKAVTFLGGGRITGALAAGLRLAGYNRPIVVYDRHPEKLKALRRESQIKIARDLKSALAIANMLIVAVRPASVEEMLEEVAACGTQAPQLCISVAAGVPLRNLRTWLRPPVRWVRAIPSPVCRVRRGLTPLSFDHGVTRRDRSLVRKFFAHVGPVLELRESQLDAVTATHTPTHGYHAVATLAQAAQKAGLDHKTALIAATHALVDGVSSWRDHGGELTELLHEAATPGGVSAAVMEAMDKAGYARVLVTGLKAGLARARRNAHLRKSKI